MRYPNIVSLRDVTRTEGIARVEINGKWMPARPLGLASFTNRIRAAWMVFTGKADALIWPENQ